MLQVNAFLYGGLLYAKGVTTNFQVIFRDTFLSLEATASSTGLNLENALDVQAVRSIIRAIRAWRGRCCEHGGYTHSD